MPTENARVMMLQVVGLSWQSMHAAASMVLDHLGIRDVGRHKMGTEYKLKNLSTRQSERNEESYKSSRVTERLRRSARP